MKRRTAIRVGLLAVLLVIYISFALATGWWFCWVLTGVFLTQLAYEAAER